MNPPPLPDELVTFVQVLVDDPELRAWFESYQETPDQQRTVEFRNIAARMHAAGETEELVRATALLAEPDVYRAVQMALRGVVED